MRDNIYVRYYGTTVTAQTVVLNGVHGYPSRVKFAKSCDTDKHWPTKVIRWPAANLGSTTGLFLYSQFRSTKPCHMSGRVLVESCMDKAWLPMFGPVLATSRMTEAWLLSLPKPWLILKWPKHGYWSQFRSSLTRNCSERMIRQEYICSSNFSCI